MCRFIVVILLLCCSCMSLPEGVEESLRLAGDNEKELRLVLQHYSKNDEDSLKFKAACFLIENMRWHYTEEQVTNIDPQVRTYCDVLDSLYYPIFLQMQKDSLVYSFHKFGQYYDWLADSVRRSVFALSSMLPMSIGDLRTMDAPFLIGHIDNAFKQWGATSYALRCNFEEFCEFLLPYRSITGYPQNYSGQELNEVYGKYIRGHSWDSLGRYVERYNFVVSNFRNFSGNRPVEHLGRYNLFFHGHECADIASYGCNVLRACGIPTMVEFCDAFRDFPGRHFYCVVRDTTGRLLSFNPESSLPTMEEVSSAIPMNIYRQYYGAQRDSPYFLRASGEVLPPLLGNPCIRDVTSERRKIFRVVVPFTDTTSNRLGYLVSFQARREMTPVTYGVINHSKGEVVFDRVLPDCLYFPVYYTEHGIRSFAAPFYVESDSMVEQGFRIRYFYPNDGAKENIVLTRKFPRKVNMIRVADDLIGSVFVGANNYDLSDAQELYRLTKTPQPYLQDYVVRNPQPYRYYCFITPSSRPHANVAWLEFLTERSRGYRNSMAPSPRAVLSPGDTCRRREDLAWVKLLDAPSWEDMKWKAEYDGNMETAPAGYSTVSFNLNDPQVVTRFRFAPKNADNGIKRGHRYELFCWSGQGWQSVGEQIARFEYLEYENVPGGSILWLRNHTAGQEELPFVVKDGEQLFFCYDY